ncbi:MAG: MFS transporter [Dehalococcoidales bacterium]|nr:MFS transporter [Dehalococcoidales bacterium]
MARVSAPVATASATLWRHHDFLKLWAGQTISMLGSRFSTLALPLIAALSLRASPVEMGLLTAVETAPFLLLGLFAGVWVDRRRRRPILVSGDVGRALLLATIPLAALAGALSMPLLYVVGFLTGVLTVFFDVAYQSYLPMLVGRAQLIEGNSKLEVSRSIAQVAGPGIAGVVVQIVSAPLAIAFDALSFFISAVFLSLIGRTEEAPDRTTRAPLLVEAREGLSVVFGNPYLRSIAGATATFNVFSSAIWALYILFATRELGLEPAAIGVVFGVGNAGALTGAVFAGHLARRLGLGRVIVGASLIGGLGNLVIASATGGFALPTLITAHFLISLSLPLYNINQVSLRQAITPERLLGRVNATNRFLVWGTMPLGGLAGGALGETLGLRPAIALAAICGLTGFLWVLRSPVSTLDRIPEIPFCSEVE